MDLVKARRKAQKDREKKRGTHAAPPETTAETRSGGPPQEPSHTMAVRETEPPAALDHEPRIPVLEGVEPEKTLPSPVPDQEKDFLELAGEELYRQSYQQTETGRRLELLCFRLASEEYAFPITEVKEIIRPRDIAEVPRVPAYVLGVISLRGVIVPVCDLRKRLGLPVREPTRATRIVIASDETKTLGMVVDEVTQVVRIPADTLDPPPPVIGGVEGEFIEAVGRDDHRMIILLNLKRIFQMDLSQIGVRP